MSKDNGGPAFPTIDAFTTQQAGPDYEVGGKGGMSLRDYFAAQALIGMLASPALLEGLTSHEVAVKSADAIVAQYAYRYADAMLAERAK